MSDIKEQNDLAVFKLEDNLNDEWAPLMQFLESYDALIDADGIWISKIVLYIPAWVEMEFAIDLKKVRSLGFMNLKIDMIHRPIYHMDLMAPDYILLGRRFTFSNYNRNKNDKNRNALNDSNGGMRGDGTESF